MKALEELGFRIRSERIAQERKQKELAAQAAVSKDALSSLEHGRPVTTETLAKILDALGYGEALENVVPAPVISPIDLQKLEGKKRQRVR